jgi:hypothetical protein
LVKQHPDWRVHPDASGAVLKGEPREDNLGTRRGHLFNGLNTSAGHGLPAMDVLLREEPVPVAGIRVRFERDVPNRFRLEPGGRELTRGPQESGAVIELPPLELHALIVGEY